MPVPTREQFQQMVVNEIQAKFPLVKLSSSEAVFSLKVNGYTASLENLYRGLVNLEEAEARRSVDRWIVELLRAAEGSPDEHAPYDELKTRIFPVVLGGARADVTGPAMVTQPFVADLVIAYGVDHDRTISYVPKKVFDSWKVSLEELHEQALENLLGKSDAMQAHAAQDEQGNVSLILFQTMDGYDASRILLPNLHEKLREYLGSPFVAGIPNRDILICFRNEPSLLAKMKQQIGSDFTQMPHQITDKLLLVTADGVAGFEG